MKIIPSENIKLTTHLKREEVILIINTIIQKKKTNIFNKREVIEYKGSINNNQFEIQRILHSRNSYSPQIKGTIYEKEGKTVIQLKLELRSPTLFFVFVFFYSIVMTFLVISIGVFTLGFNPLYSIIPVVAFLLIKLTMIAEFNRESDIIEKDLKNIFSTGNLHN